jgi:tetratricopeptide (TPR) repeat protein
MLRTRFFLICIFLSVILSTGRINASDNFGNALRYYNEGKFFIASIEFERAVFYETDPAKIAQYKYYKSLCYKKTGDTKKALGELDEINLYRLPDTLLFLIRYEAALCNYINGDPNKAIWLMDEIRISSPDSAEVLNIIPLNILCLNSVRKWNEAYELWLYLLERTNFSDVERQNLIAEIDDIYKVKSLPKYYRPKKAENLSRFIPGSGQIYSGAIGEGTFNFLMNATILGFAAYEFYTEYYFTGYFVGLGLLNKTYNGGIRRAGILADKRNNDTMNDFNTRIASILIRVFDAEL